MRRVIVVSPLSGDREKNKLYARLCMRDCFHHYNEAPLACHALYDHEDVLDDEDADDRKLGMAAGIEWGRDAYAYVIYEDLGPGPERWSSGMHIDAERARVAGIRIEVRKLPPEMWHEFVRRCEALR